MLLRPPLSPSAALLLRSSLVNLRKSSHARNSRTRRIRCGHASGLGLRFAHRKISSVARNSRGTSSSSRTADQRHRRPSEFVLESNDFLRFHSISQTRSKPVKENFPPSFLNENVFFVSSADFVIHWPPVPRPAYVEVATDKQPSRDKLFHFLH